MYLPFHSQTHDAFTLTSRVANPMLNIRKSFRDSRHCTTYLYDSSLRDRNVRWSTCGENCGHTALNRRAESHPLKGDRVNSSFTRGPKSGAFSVEISLWNLARPESRIIGIVTGTREPRSWFTMRKREKKVNEIVAEKKNPISRVSHTPCCPIHLQRSMMRGTIGP